MATSNNDLGHQQTETKLEQLERKIAAVYREAAADVSGTIERYFARFEKLDAEKRKLLDAGEITKQEYIQWRLSQITRGERYTALRDALAERMTKANEVAAAYINDELPGIYSLNRNYAAYTIEKVSGNISFTLFDEETVRRLLTEKPDLMPYYPPERAVERGIDLAWGKQQITNQVQSSILTGQGIPDIAKDLRSIITGMNRASAIRAARTSMTSAQNGGRLASYERAAQMGINVRKVWVATKDDRTRQSHQILDGETVNWDKNFSNGLRYPGDPSGPGREVYNCRCTMRTEVPKNLEAEPRMMRVRDPKTGKNVLVKEMTYAEWERWVKERES